MIVTRFSHASVVLVIAAAVAVTGCGGDSGSATAGGGTQKQPSSPPEPTSGEPTAVLQSATIPGLGKVLVDSAYKTLYYFDRDKRGSGKTNCYGACGREWYYKPSGTKPIIAPGGELNYMMTGTIRRSDGSVQATYNGWPLYTNIREYNEETTHVGKNSYGGRWFPLHPDGTRAGEEFRTGGQQ